MSISIPDTLRFAGKTGVNAGIVAQASIIGKELEVAPKVTETISSISDQLPELLTISSEIPGIGDFLTQFEWLRTLSEDAQNFGNIAAYMGIFAAIYWIGRITGGQKGRMEAFGNSIVWTSLAAGVLNEFYQFTQENGRDFFSWMPLGFFEGLSEEVRDYLFESSENRKEAWAFTSLGIGTLLSYLGVKNAVQALLGPKKK